MTLWKPKSLSLLWKILLSTSIATTLLFAMTAWFVNAYVLRETERSVMTEVHSSLREYQALWRAKADNLARISVLLSTMSDVRAAFSTSDVATIRDSAGDLWHRISQEGALFLVFDPQGREIASLGGDSGALRSLGGLIKIASTHFPNQVSGFEAVGGHLYYLLLTPVYVDAAHGQELLNVLAAGFIVDNRLAGDLKSATEGSDFAFFAGDRAVALTLPAAQILKVNAIQSERAFPHVRLAGVDYAAAVSNLNDTEGRAVARLCVMRSLENSTRRLHTLSQTITEIWIATLLGGFLLSYLLASRIIGPVKALDRAAAEITKRNYDYRVSIESQDELGRLAGTFNSMCDSIQVARDELISQERLNTVGRLSSSIVHDLRNPLAAIYAGAEMLMDSAEMAPVQARRLATNIYRASQRIQQLLQDLGQSVHGRSDPLANCLVTDLVESALYIVEPVRQAQNVTLTLSIPAELAVQVHRSRIERVFLNLISNSLEAMPEGGLLEIAAGTEGGFVQVEIDDTGVGLSDDVRKQLFRPFFTSGKRSGLGLGLALSRQTLLDHGGNLWASHKSGTGARFCLQLPVSVAAAESVDSASGQSAAPLVS